MSEARVQVNVQTKVAPKVEPKTEPKQPWLWNVVLLDDQDHTYDYVIRMMQSVFGYPKEKALSVAEVVDKRGRAVCMTTHKEHAELKCEQITSFGKDPLMQQCKGPMSSIIEPAATDGDEPNKS